MPGDFFDSPKEQSEVKSAIVQKYFVAWSQVMLPTVKKRRSGTLAYFDFFSGPGIYGNGTKSTPLLVLENALTNSDLCNHLVTIFNDENPKNLQMLQTAIKQLPGIKKLKHQPLLLNFQIDEDMGEILGRISSCPTLLFADPFGYKGLSQGLINAVLRRWGSECIIFFNYNRVNAAVPNDGMRIHMDALFGRNRVDSLRSQLAESPSQDHEKIIIEGLYESLTGQWGKFVLPFRFKNEKGTRTSHHLIFVTKHFKAYDIMKGIMAKESSVEEEGVPTFEYNEATARQPLLFDLNRPLEDLRNLLLEDYAGKTLTVKEIYEQHSIGKRYIGRNYKDVFRQLEEEGMISCDPPLHRRRRYEGKASFGEKVTLNFKNRRK